MELQFHSGAHACVRHWARFSSYTHIAKVFKIKLCIFLFSFAFAHLIDEGSKSKTCAFLLDAFFFWIGLAKKSSFFCEKKFGGVNIHISAESRILFHIDDYYSYQIV